MYVTVWVKSQLGLTPDVAKQSWIFERYSSSTGILSLPTTMPSISLGFACAYHSCVRISLTVKRF